VTLSLAQLGGGAQGGKGERRKEKGEGRCAVLSQAVPPILVLVSCERREGGRSLEKRGKAPMVVCVPSIPLSPILHLRICRWWEKTKERKKGKIAKKKKGKGKKKIMRRFSLVGQS